jgi:hypothetical protein
MSVKSTHMVTRDFAISVIISKVLVMSDDDLGDALEEVLRSEYHNFVVVSQKRMRENKLKEWPDPYLDDPDNLPDKTY